MIKISLPVPMLLNTQLKRIAKGTGISFEELESLMEYKNALFVTNNEDCSKTLCILTDCMATNTEGNLVCVIEKEVKDESLFGAEAILFLCERAGVQVKPIEEIEIPCAVFDKTSSTAWLDISCLAARVERRTNRIKKLAKADVPYVIMFNEYRMLYEAICELEHNNLYRANHRTLRHENGEPFVPLASVGYSLTGKNFKVHTPEEMLLRTIFGKMSNGQEKDEEE